MSAAIKYAPHYRVDDYRQWKGDWELWDGIAIAMSPSHIGPHQAVLVALASELRGALRDASCNATVLVELDWIIKNDTVVRPDVIVVRGAPPRGTLAVCTGTDCRDSFTVNTSKRPNVQTRALRKPRRRHLSDR